MKNKTISLLIVLLLTIFSVACNSNFPNREIKKDQNLKKATVTDTSSKSPDFVKDRVFTGGTAAQNYTLNGIRKRPNPIANPTANRIHINFGIVGDSTLPGEPPVLAEQLPLYEISYSDSQRKVTAIFKGVKWDISQDKVQKLKELTPIIKDLNVDINDGKLHVIFTLEEPVSLKVLDYEQPAGISIIIKPDADIN